MSEAQQSTDLHSYFTKRFPNDPQLAADAAALHQGIGWTPPPEQPEPAAGEAPPLKSAPAVRRRIDWGQAARLLAGGSSIEDAARQLRCEPQAIRRNLRRSRRFRLRIEGEHEHCRLMTQLRFGALGDYAVSHLKLHPENPRLLQWLGDRIGLGTLTSRQAGGLALRLQAALNPGKRIPTDAELEERRLTKADIERMMREVDEWHDAKDAHERMKFEKAEFEKRQRVEEARETGESDAD